MLAYGHANNEDHHNPDNVVDFKNRRKRCAQRYSSIQCFSTRNGLLRDAPCTTVVTTIIVATPYVCCECHITIVLGLMSFVLQTRAYGGGPQLAQAAASAPRGVGEGQLFYELALVWQELLSRFAVAREGRAQAQMLLTALKLAIAALRIAPLSPDGR